MTESKTWNTLERDYRERLEAARPYVMDGKVVEAGDTVKLLEAVIRPGDKGIAKKVDFSFSGPQAGRLAEYVRDGKIELGAIHTYLELYGRYFLDLTPRVALCVGVSADRDGNIYTGFNTEDTPVIAEAVKFRQGVVVVQVNEIVDEVPRVDIPGDWVDFVIQAPRPFYIEPLFTRDPALITDSQVLRAMMVIKGIYAEYGIQRLNHGIGFDTAANTAIECIDKLRDTMQSHERCSVVEVMGRNAGYLAMYVGLAVGATAVLVPEEPIDFERDVIEKIRQARFNGFTHYMIVVAEGAGSAADIAAKIKDAIDLDPRVTVLGHIQRGGSPTGRDRVNATKMGYLAVELLLQGKTNRIVCTHMGDFTDVDISEGLAMKKSIQKMEVDVLAAMTGI